MLISWSIAVFCDKLLNKMARLSLIIACQLNHSNLNIQCNACLSELLRLIRLKVPHLIRPGLTLIQPIHPSIYPSIFYSRLSYSESEILKTIFFVNHFISHMHCALASVVFSCCELRTPGLWSLHIDTCQILPGPLATEEHVFYQT